MANDYYRPNSYQQAPINNDFPPPPPDMPPMPPPRVFGTATDSWRPSNNHYDPCTSSQQNEFTFNVNGRAPAYPFQAGKDQMRDSYRPAQRNGQSYRSRGRGRGARIIPAERPLLQAQQEEAIQKTLGIAGEPGAQRFNAADDATDSEEEPMDQSDPENETSPRPVLVNNDGTAESLEPPTKRRALAKDSKEGSSVPKWSNPDPYTVLPPVDEEQRKKKDVVKLIRKARIATEKEEATQNEVAANDDFISFGFEDDNVTEDETTGGAQGVAGAPTGPRSRNEPQRRQDRLPHMPPPIPASQLGPPPGLTSNSFNALPPKPTQDRTRNTAAYRDGHDSNLGSRKRTHDDEIKPARSRGPPPMKKGKGIPPNGSLINEWVPPRNQDSTPWVVRSQYLTENAGFRLHKEICDFYEFVKPRQFEQVIREDLIQRIQAAVRQEIPDSDLHCFGSFAAGLYLPNADMDVVVISKSFREMGIKSACQTNTKMRKFGNYLESTVAERGSVDCITGAKVPIIKFVDRVTAIRVDLSFENDTGIIANNTFAHWKQQFPAMPILVTVIKQFLMMRGMNDVATGGLGGFSVTCLVTSLLQNMPRVQTGEIIPEQHLGEMLIEFLDFYGNQLDISRTGISMNPPGYFDKVATMRRKSVYQENKSDRLAIIDPNTPENDISGGSRVVSMIFDRFSRAHEEIMIALRSSHRISLLDWMLGGDYENFTWQRDHLQDLYEQRWGPVKAESFIQHDAVQSHMPSTVPSSQAHVGEHGLDGSSFVAYNGFSHSATTTIIETPNTVQSSQQPEDHPKPKKQKIQRSAAKSAVKKNRDKVEHANKPGVKRAMRLRKQYPHMQGIPGSVSKKGKKRLAAEYKQQKADAPNSDNTAHNIAPAKRSRTRWKTSNNNRGGTSTNDPITID